MLVAIIAMIIIAIMFSTVVNGITKGCKWAVESGRTQSILDRRVELLDQFDLINFHGEILDMDRLNCYLYAIRTQYELFLTKEMTLHILKLGESKNDLYLYTIKFSDILEMRIQDKDFIIITEQRGFTLGGIVDYAEMERCKLVIEREISKEKNGSN